MALAQYSELFWVPSGALAANVPARVFLHSTNTLATLYADAGGTTPLANPLLTSGTGRLEFWAEEGSYWIHIDSEAFEVAVGAAAQPATQQDITDEVTRADATYATILVVNALTGTVTALSGTVTTLNGFVNDCLARVAAIENGTAFLAGLNIDGDAQIANGNLVVTNFVKGYRFRTDGGALDLEGTGSDLLVSVWSGGGFNGTQHSYLRLSADAQNVQVAGRVEYVDALYGTTRHVLDGAANQAGFFGATPISRPAVAGSWADGSAGVSLADALADLGLITNNTTP